MATFVEGEAPETDSEDEQFSLSTVNMKGRLGESLKSGYISKSEESKSLKLKSGLNIIDGSYDFKTTSASTAKGAEFFYENELFKKKINEKASANFRDFIQYELAPISKQLIETDNSLINTQLTLQNATTTIKKVNDRYELIYEKLINLIDCNFLSNVKISTPETET